MNKLSIVLLLLITSCLTNKDVARTNVQEIKFGNGGGFTGKLTTYSLAQNGVFEKDNIKIKTIKLKETLALYEDAKNLKDYNFNDPENVYSFIEIKTKTKTNKIVWHTGSKNIDPKVINLYNNLFSEIN